MTPPALTNICARDQLAVNAPESPLTPPELFAQVMNSTPASLIEVRPVQPDPVSSPQSCGDPAESPAFSEITSKLQIADTRDASGDHQGAQVARGQADAKINSELDKATAEMPKLVAPPSNDPSGKPPPPVLPGMQEPPPLETPVALDYIKSVVRLGKFAQVTGDTAGAERAGQLIVDFVDSQLVPLYEDRMSTINDYALAGRNFDDLVKTVNVLMRQIDTLKMIAEALDSSLSFDSEGFEQEHTRQLGDSWQKYARIKFNSLGCHPGRDAASEIGRALRKAYMFGTLSEDEALVMMRSTWNVRMRDQAQTSLSGADRNAFITASASLGLDDLKQELINEKVTPIICDDEGSFTLKAISQQSMIGGFDVQDPKGTATKIRWKILRDFNSSFRYTLLRQDKLIEDGESTDDKVVSYRVRIETLGEMKGHDEADVNGKGEVQDYSFSCNGLVAPASLNNPLTLKVGLHRIRPSGQVKIQIDLDSLTSDRLQLCENYAAGFPNPSSQPNLDEQGFIMTPTAFNESEKFLLVSGEMSPEDTIDPSNPLAVDGNNHISASFDLKIDIGNLWPKNP